MYSRPTSPQDFRMINQKLCPIRDATACAEEATYLYWKRSTGFHKTQSGYFWPMIRTINWPFTKFLVEPCFIERKYIWYQSEIVTAVSRSWPSYVCPSYAFHYSHNESIDIPSSVFCFFLSSSQIIIFAVSVNGQYPPIPPDVISCRPAYGTGLDVHSCLEALEQMPVGDHIVAYTDGQRPSPEGIERI